MKKLLYYVLLISLIVFCYQLAHLSYLFFNKMINPDIVKSILTVSSFSFGIYVGFNFANSRAKYMDINKSLDEINGSLYFFCSTAQAYAHEFQIKIKDLVETYLIAQIDNPLIDFSKSEKEYAKLSDFLINLKLENKNQEILFNRISQTLSNHCVSRERVETLAGTTIKLTDWLVMWALYLISVFCLLYISIGIPLMIGVSTILAFSIGLVLYILKDLDSLTWQEDSNIWIPMNNLFLELGFVPYLPKDIFKRIRRYLTKGQKVRIVECTKTKKEKKFCEIYA